ncbi:THAP domain-containing protein 6-like [Eriocheir sinensis]|uniref:THAP domain-containing protein 6-like n=1 Tax=Eriocheir sinensis TaxID=95602 RepID=UPI0021CA9B2E|nr:THAP domain-containing protein 6-like [Eriocheir sinensis]
MPACSAYGCTKRDRSGSTSFHRFPRDEVLRRKWILATRRLNFNPSRSAVLCSRHFVEEDFDRTTPNYTFKITHGVFSLS